MIYMKQHILKLTIRSQAPNLAIEESMEKVQRLNGYGKEHGVIHPCNEFLRYSLVPGDVCVSPLLIDTSNADK